MKRFNMFYYGEDISHCGSCRESHDVTLWALFTTLSLKDMEKKFVEYILDSSEKWDGYGAFLEEVTRAGSDEDGNMVYPCIFFEEHGSEFPPDIDLSNIVEEEYDLERYLIPEEIFGKKDWKDIQDRWKKIKKERLEREVKLEKEETKKLKEELKKKKEKEEYNQYKKLKKKWEKPNDR